MIITLEILFTALAVLGSGAMIVLSRTRRPIGLFQRYVLVLFAPVPVWFFGQLLWNVFIDHRRGLGFPGWFWTVLLIFAILVGVCFSIHRRQLYHQVQIKYSPLAFAQLLGAAVALVLIVINLYGWKSRPHWVQLNHMAWAGRFLLLAAILVVLGFVLVWIVQKLGIALLVAAGLILVLALATLLISNGGNHSHQAAPKASVSTSASTPSATPTVTVTQTASAVPANINANTVANGLNPILNGYKPGQVTVGSQNIDWQNHQATHGVNDFTTGNTVLKTQTDVAKFLNGSSARSKAAKAQVIAAIKKAGYGQSEINRALNGTGYLPLQVKVASQFLGTTYFSGGKVLTVNGWRAINANDVFWVFIALDSHVIKDATVRADCGNAHLEQLRPVTPTTPPAPPATCASCQPIEKCVTSGTSGPGYKLVGCTWIKVSCTKYGMQTCGGPNYQYQPVQSNNPSLLVQPSSVPSTKPSPLVPGPGGSAAPPSSPASVGYNPSGGAAPGGGSSNGGSTSVGTPKPNPTAVCDPANGCNVTQTSSAPQPK